jgi:hypothetical protein
MFIPGIVWLLNLLLNWVANTGVPWEDGDSTGQVPFAQRYQRVGSGGALITRIAAVILVHSRGLQDPWKLATQRKLYPGPAVSLSVGWLEIRTLLSRRSRPGFQISRIHAPASQGNSRRYGNQANYSDRSRGGQSGQNRRIHTLADGSFCGSD